MQNQAETMRERLLVAALRGGSREAFDEIYRRYSGRLLAYCVAVVKNNDDAKEIVQEAFIKLWDMRGDIRSDEGVAALLFRMAKNRIVDAFRRQLSHGVYDDYLIYTDNIAAPGSTADGIEYGEFKAKVRTALRRLPPTQRKVIALCRLGGLTAAQTAQKLGLSEQTVKNQLSIGLKRLYSILK